MRLEESLAIEEILQRETGRRHRGYASVVNLGCGDVGRLARTKPWVHQHVFKPLADDGARVVHADAMPFPGVDVVCDLAAPDALDFVCALARPRLFVLANVLEHVPSDARCGILKKIEARMDRGDSLLITAPYDYPYHPDPIDTLYRPGPSELERLADLNWVEESIVDCGSFREEFARMSLPKKVRKLLKVLWVLQPPAKYLESAHRLLFLFKPYRISIVLGSK